MTRSTLSLTSNVWNSLSLSLSPLLYLSRLMSETFSVSLSYSVSHVRYMKLSLSVSVSRFRCLKLSLSVSHV